MDIRNFFGSSKKKKKKTSQKKRKASPDGGQSVINLAGSSSKQEAVASKRRGTKGIKPETPATASSQPVKQSPEKPKAPPPSKKPPPTRAASSSGRRWYGKKDPEPPKLSGNSQLPKGAPGCLEGLTFVMTGLGSKMNREEFVDLVMQYGGKTTTAVSSKTDYLVRGYELEDGRKVEEGSKHRKAMELLEQKKEAGAKGSRVKLRAVLTEDEFFALIKDRAEHPEKREPVKPKKPGLSEEQLKRLAANRAKALARKAAREAQKATSVREQYSRKVSSSSATSDASNGHSSAWATHLDGSNSLWAEMFRPGSMEDLIGNVGNANKVRDWLSTWHRRFGANDCKDTKNRGCLMSGPPGIGKTSTAIMVAKTMGFEVVERNASVKRAKSDVKGMAEFVNTGSLNFSGKRKDKKRKVLIMDEVDGMSAGDRGGAAGIAELIAKSRSPVICICNDAHAKKLAPLKRVCLPLTFMRPQAQTVARRICALAATQGLQVEHNAVVALATSVGGDIRQVLNTLQMWSRRTKNIKYTDYMDEKKLVKKDEMLRLTAMDAFKNMIEKSHELPYSKRYESFFTDYSLIPLLMQESYITTIGSQARHNGGASSVQTLEKLASAADTISMNDVIGGNIMASQDWGALRYVAALNTGIGYIANGYCGGFPGFPAWFGKNSKRNKRYRLLTEMTMNLKATISGSPQAVRQSYLPVFRDKLLKPLAAGKEGVDEVIKMLQDFGLSKDDFMETMAEFQFESVHRHKKGGDDKYKAVDTATRRALTAQFKKKGHFTQAAAHSDPNALIKKGKVKKKAGGSTGKKKRRKKR